MERQGERKREKDGGWKNYFSREEEMGDGKIIFLESLLES